MQLDKRTSSSQRSSRIPSVILMTFFLEKSTFILKLAVQLSLQQQQSPHQSHPQSLITEPCLNLNLPTRLPKAPLRHRLRKRNLPPKRQHLLVVKVCLALGHLPIVPLCRTLR